VCLHEVGRNCSNTVSILRWRSVVRVIDLVNDPERPVIKAITFGHDLVMTTRSHPLPTREASHASQGTATDNQIISTHLNLSIRVMYIFRMVVQRAASTSHDRS